MSQETNENDTKAEEPNSQQNVQEGVKSSDIDTEGESEELVLTKYLSDLGYEIFFDSSYFELNRGKSRIGNNQADTFESKYNDGSYTDIFLEVGYIPDIDIETLNQHLKDQFHLEFPNGTETEIQAKINSFGPVNGGYYYTFMQYPQDAEEGAAIVMNKMVDTFKYR